MNLHAEPLITVTSRGLYCRAGDFYIDPGQPVQTAVITHAHGDHLRHGSARYILARPGATIAAHRLGRSAETAAVDYGERLSLASTVISLHPAGHILGSSQVRIEHAGQVWVVSGDYKRQADPTCAPFEPLECDVFISEATFAQPAFAWPDTANVIAEILGWWHANRERGIASVLFCYALGKAQRVLAELHPFADAPVYLHGAVDALTTIYRRTGVQMVRTLNVSAARTADYRGALIIAPPGAAGTPWMKRFGEHSTGFCSGWMLMPRDRHRHQYDRGFVLSDHADWRALVETCAATRARRILLMHGESDTLVRHLNENGTDAGELATARAA